MERIKKSVGLLFIVAFMAAVLLIGGCDNGTTDDAQNPDKVKTWLQQIFGSDCEIVNGSNKTYIVYGFDGTIPVPLGLDLTRGGVDSIMNQDNDGLDLNMLGSAPVEIHIHGVSGCFTISKLDEKFIIVLPDGSMFAIEEEIGSHIVKPYDPLSDNTSFKSFSINGEAAETATGFINFSVINAVASVNVNYVTTASTTTLELKQVTGNGHLSWVSLSNSSFRVDGLEAGSFNEILLVLTAESGRYKEYNLSIYRAKEDDVLAESVSLNKSSTTLIMGNTETLIATVYPEKTADKRVSWSSSAPAIANVNSNGLVTAFAPGSAVITVTTEDGGHKATCTVTVNPLPVTGVNLNKSSTTLIVGATETLTANVLPANAGNKAVTWSSSASAVTVNQSGLVTAVAVGNAVITVTTTEGGFTSTCNVTVNPVPVASVSLNKNTLTLRVDETERLTATVLPANAANKNVIWSSSAPGFASVDASGLVTAVAVGKADITVATVDGNRTSVCEVTVLALPVTSVNLNKSGIALAAGDSETLIATVLPEKAGNKAVTWSSSAQQFATVNANGLVTAVAEGSATITVTTVDGSLKATCIVSVSPVRVTGVTLNKNSMTLASGDKEQLTATVLPTNATNKNVTWFSFNSAVASVDPTGMVTAVAVGNVDIRAISSENNEHYSICSVTVSAVAVSSVSLKPNTTLAVGASETLIPSFVPANATNKNVTWSSSNTPVATVDPNGIVRAVTVGTATITVTTADGGRTGTCIVTVPAAPVTGVTLNKTATTITAGNTEQLTATVSPSNATDKNVTWSSSNTVVATVNTGGVVTAHSSGTATITATTVDGGHTASCVVTVPSVAVTGVTLNKTSTTITVGNTEQLTATVAPSNATNKNVTWSSLQPQFATVDEAGIVTAIATGTATIRVTTADGGRTANCTVTVPTVTPTSVSLNHKTLTLTVGATDTSLVATVLPANAANKNVSWSSSSNAVATVNSSGAVTAVSAGSVTITVTTTVGSHTDTCIVTVGSVAVTGVTLNKTNTSITVGNEETLVATIYPTNASNKNVTWYSYNQGVATVSASGVVKAIAAGTTNIRVTADGGQTAECTVTVPVPVSGVTLNKPATSITVGKTEQLTATVNPSNADNKNVNWSSSAPGVATVNTSGLVTAVSAGTATITVTTVDGGRTANCTVTVPVPVSGVSLNKTSTTLVLGGTETLTATVLPSNAANKSVTWSSSSTAVATVSTTGLVTARALGSAVITVTTDDGEYKATCNISVGAVPVSGVNMSKSTTSIIVGGTEQLNATVLPSEAGNKAVNWSSNNTPVATVSNGLVTTHAVGTATITVTTVDGGFTATCLVTVTPVVVTGVTLNKTSTSLTAGNTEQLTATVAPSNATDKNVTWSTSASGVATVSTTGLVTAVSAGTATITVTTVDNSHTAQCTVNVSADFGIKIEWEDNGMLLNAVTTPSASLVSQNPLTIKLGASLAITPVNNFDTYQWTLDRVVVGTSRTYTFVPTATGVYRIILRVNGTQMGATIDVVVQL